MIHHSDTVKYYFIFFSKVRELTFTWSVEFLVFASICVLYQIACFSFYIMPVFN